MDDYIYRNNVACGVVLCVNNLHYIGQNSIKN
jgi:hypothetical protein